MCVIISLIFARVGLQWVIVAFFLFAHIHLIFYHIGESPLL